MKNAFNIIVTTFVIIFPQFILKSHPFFADTIGIALAVIVSCAFGLEYS